MSTSAVCIRTLPPLTPHNCMKRNHSVKIERYQRYWVVKNFAKRSTAHRDTSKKSIELKTKSINTLQRITGLGTLIPSERTYQCDSLQMCCGLGWQSLERTILFVAYEVDPAGKEENRHRPQKTTP